MCALIHRTKQDLNQQISDLSTLAEHLQAAASIDEKIEHLNKLAVVKSFFSKVSQLRTILAGLSPDCELIVKELIAIDQGDHLFTGYQISPHSLRQFIDELFSVEKFYAHLGGLVGYHLMMLRFLTSINHDKQWENCAFRKAPQITIFEENDFVNEMTAEGIESLPFFAEIYPVGGAADRLNLHDPVSKEALPAAVLQFGNMTLLEGLIEDVQAREYLYWKLHQKQVITPICMMTSKEKDNHQHIKTICREMHWFNRPKESLRLICQPLVPTIDREGNWCMQAPLELLMKPGGHGVIWKLAQEEGIFDWFRAEGRSKILARQINNPMAGLDSNLLCFSGYGYAKDKRFGFASCPRKVASSEGMNVLVERERDNQYQYCLTNIEYTDFQKHNIVDEPEYPGDEHSKFSSNTNILFGDIESLNDAVNHFPVPGMLINFKKAFCFGDKNKLEEREVARLESTMQNIADDFIDTFDQRITEEGKHQLSTFLTYNKREKTISTAKREFSSSLPLNETPEGCFLDWLKNARELLTEYCHFSAPKLTEGRDYLLYGPSFIFRYHAALGPLYSVIARKLRGGTLASRAELDLQIAEANIENLHLEGSLLIRADEVMGHIDEHHHLHYSHKGGKCTLINVNVINQGIDHSMANIYWKNEVQRLEQCEIIVHGHGEFYAENVTFEGDLKIEVPSNTCIIAEQQGDGVVFRSKPIDKPSWHWNYNYTPDRNVELTLETS